TVYLLGNIEHMADNEKQAIAHLKKFETEEKYVKTPIAAKALYTYGAIACQYRMDGEEYEATWQRVLPLVIKHYPDTPEAEQATFHMGFSCYHTGRQAEAQQFYAAYLRRYPEGGFRKIVESHLMEINNEN
ncbi:MAG: hypothetical protein GVY24_06335, partial [Planctomycetes bacterium]|nr:hypothetical protein [Planctomycetota bacterium]